MFKSQFSKQQDAWAFYDWANSVYPLVISTAIFPIFYAAKTSARIDGVLNDTVLFLGYSFKNTELISYVLAFSYLLIVLISPVLSAVADLAGRRKLFMQAFCYLGGLSCMGLFFFDSQKLELSLIPYILASVGFWGSLVFYNSFLPLLAKHKQMDRLSAKGYSYGYIGSLLLLIINLVMIKGFGIDVKWCFVSVGLWWIGFAQVTFSSLPKETSQEKGKSYLKIPLEEFKKVRAQVLLSKGLKWFLIAFFVYSIAVQTIIAMAVYFGEKEILWPNDDEKSTGMIVSILLVQLIAILGAYLHAKLSKRYGNKHALIASISMWIALCLFAFFCTLPLHFYIMAGLIGLVFGGIQSLSRSSYSKLIPDTLDQTSFFSFYDITEKIALVIGIFTYGLLEGLTGSMRASIIFLTFVFILSLVLLFFVPKKSFERN